MKYLPKLFILFLAAANSVQQNNVLIFNCELIQQTYRYFNNVHSCNVKEDLNVRQENVELDIASRLIYVYVSAFSIMNKCVFYLPNGIKKFFPNLEILEVIRSNLKKISRQNLQSFEKLKYLDLSGNNIQTLEGKLFQFNLKLEVLILNDNEISTVDKLTFYGLLNLNFLGFQRNRCLSDMSEDANAVQDMIDDIKCSCSEENNRHSMNLEIIKKNVDKYGKDISTLRSNLYAVIEENTKITNSFDAHNKAVEELRRQLFERQGKLENTINQQVVKLRSETQKIRVDNNELRRISSLARSCKQNIQEVATNVTGINIQNQKLSANLHDLNFTILHKFDSIWKFINISQTKACNSSTTNSTDLIDFLNKKGIFTNKSKFYKWVNTTMNLVSVVNGVKSDIQVIQNNQEYLSRNVSFLINNSQRLDQFNGNSSFFANILTQNPTELMCYLIILNITLIILFCCIIIYLCCTRKPQNKVSTTKKLRIQPPTYRHLLESPLDTPSNLNQNSIYGQYEYIDENVQGNPAFEDFYAEATQPVRNERENDGSEDYAVAYRPERY